MNRPEPIDKESLRARLRARASTYLPANARRYTAQFVTRAPGVTNEMLGIPMEARPFTGKLIDRWEDGTLVARKGRELAFCVVSGDALATHDAAIGDEIVVLPYARRRFDGKRCDTPQIEERTGADGVTLRTSSILLGGHDAQMPVQAEHSQYLGDMLEQIKKLPATDGFRRLEHVLVDAKARNLRVVDPTDAHIIETPPALECEVDTKKFTGSLAIVYDRGIDYYRVELRKEGAVVNQAIDVAFTELAETVERMVDDDEWRLARVEVLRRAASPRARRAA